MSDLQAYIKKRKANDKVFVKNFDSGYATFRSGLLLAIATHLLTKWRFLR